MLNLCSYPHWMFKSVIILRFEVLQVSEITDCGATWAEKTAVFFSWLGFGGRAPCFPYRSAPASVGMHVCMLACQ